MKTTLRELFWIVLVVALSLGWWVDHRRLTTQLMMIDAAGRDAVPWMIAAAGVDPDAQAQLNQVLKSYQTASPTKRAQMEQEAMMLLSGLDNVGS